MPSPRKGESEHEYIQRAIRHMVDKENITYQQASGKAYGIWRERAKWKKRAG